MAEFIKKSWNPRPFPTIYLSHQKYTEKLSIRMNIGQSVTGRIQFPIHKIRKYGGKTEIKLAVTILIDGLVDQSGYYGTIKLANEKHLEVKGIGTAILKTCINHLIK